MKGQVQIHLVSQFNDSSTESTTYLGKTDRRGKGVMKAQEQFSVTDQSTTKGTLLDGTDCKILLDSGATKGFMSELYYLKNTSLHGIPRFSSKAEVIKIGNRERVNILFIISIIVTIQGYMFEIYAMVLRYMVMYISAGSQNLCGIRRRNKLKIPNL